MGELLQTSRRSAKGNLVLTLLDSKGNGLEESVAQLLEQRMAQGQNKVLWWGNRGILLRFRDQYGAEKVSGDEDEKVSGKQG